LVGRSCLLSEKCCGSCRYILHEAEVMMLCIAFQFLQTVCKHKVFSLGSQHLFHV
jgi:hypothetical protein